MTVSLDTLQEQCLVSTKILILYIGGVPVLLPSCPELPVQRGTV